ncbi:MAG: tetratricopeptide repeat protein [Candidatus Heimdallarchaeota archaeon]|nr:tetratricopeptide repeat protein [Candidatus Heimdallarchaeota archaeon]
MVCEVVKNRLERGKLALEKWNLEEALEQFSKGLLEEHYQDSDYWSKLAETLYYQKRYEESLKCWLVAASQNPQSKKIWVKISALFALLGQKQKAIRYYLLSEELPIEG